MDSEKPVVLLLVIDAAGLETFEYILGKYRGKIKLPNLSRLGLGRIIRPEFRNRLGKDGKKTYAVRLQQASASADSVIGHREMVGIIDDRTYNLFPEGFPERYIKALEEKIGRKTFFNKMAGGMEAIELNCDEHEKTGRPIVYASKCDPLIQLAMNENVIPVKEQHGIADAAFELAREMGIRVTRAIARAYIRDSWGGIIRTANRHDAVLPMESKTLVDLLYGNDVWTAAVGKTSELVNTSYHEKIKLARPAFLDPEKDLKFVHPGKKDTNPYSIQGTINALVEARSLYRSRGTFIFSNLVDTDSVYGHTRDVEGWVRCVEEVDRKIPVFEKLLKKGDLFIITADHGMEHREDYGYHSKEDLPLIAERVGFDSKLGGIKTGGGKTLAEAGWLAAQAFGLGAIFIKECKMAGKI